MISRRLLKKIAKYLVLFAIFVVCRTGLSYLLNDSTHEGETSSTEILPTEILLKQDFDLSKDTIQRSDLHSNKNLADIRKDFYKQKLKNVPVDLIYNWNQRDRARGKEIYMPIDPTVSWFGSVRFRHILGVSGSVRFRYFFFNRNRNN